MKRKTQVYLAMTLIGVLLVGLGSGISIFEISNYKTFHYQSTEAAALNLPLLEPTTDTIEVTLQGTEPFKFDTSYWWCTPTDVQIDNSLQNQVRIQLTYPQEIFEVYLEHIDSNHYQLSLESHGLEMTKLWLQAAKEGYIIDDMPPMQVTLFMNEAQAKTFKVNEERDRTEEIAADYDMQIQSMQENFNEQTTAYEERFSEQQMHFDEQLQNQQNNFDEQLQNQQNNFNEQLQNQQEQYEEQLRLKDEQIQSLQQQLDDVRNSLN